MKRLNLNLDDKTIKKLEFLQDWYNVSKTDVIKIAIANLDREIWDENLSPSTVGQQGGPTVLGEGKRGETDVHET